MTEQKHIVTMMGIVLSVSLIASSITAFLLCGYYNRIGLSGGYGQPDFLQPAKYSRLFAVIGFFAGAALFGTVILLWHRQNTRRIRQLIDYLERVNIGRGGELFWVGEDDFSRLQDEIYKTVTKLYQTADAALAAKNSFADNLSNIAHQLKTPITSMLLSVQMMREKPSPHHLEQLCRQLTHLVDLEEGLLLLSRMDAGTLPLERREADAFTILTLAADNLQELSEKTGVSIEIPEMGPALLHADVEWTMEAVMNLMKNCMEHTASGGTVFCSYEQNPIYTQIRIWDDGAGFAREDIPHLFERFYRGKHQKGEGLGIGLALSKAVIESQNGTISACNRPEGGACFDIRMYCH
ncbi:MAG: HAMP domain-containing histidine kinase [Eubacterium sp.]|nr:HAMP domain-containing histidine kinase [Eubacterium sp.]